MKIGHFSVKFGNFSMKKAGFLNSKSFDHPLPQTIRFKKGITPKMTKSNLTGSNLSAHAVYFSPCLCPGPPVPVRVRAQSELIDYMLA